jgi:hypothetical protein
MNLLQVNSSVRRKDSQSMPQAPFASTDEAIAGARRQIDEALAA